MMLNWTIFENLPGSRTDNFEILSRSMIWLVYSRYGTFRAQLNQPGVEFDLKLDSDCNLGCKGRHFGWQCRWWDLARGTNIGKTRQNKIKDALEKSIASIDGLTDWVLWTRYPLTKSDQEWFYSLTEKPKLHLWSSYQTEALLDTECEQLKHTYFGELILRPEQLELIHKQSIEPIKKRWFPEVHQEVDAERSVQRILGRAIAWDELNEISGSITELYGEIQLRTSTVPEPLQQLANDFLSCMLAFAEELTFTFDKISRGEFMHLKQSSMSELTERFKQVSSLPRKLRGARLQIGVIATNALADLKEALWRLSEIRALLDTRLVGVVADAGGGKTQLSATLTSPQENRPAGILLLGRFFKHDSSIDDLARKIVIEGKPVQSMQGLIASLNAAAERAKCILPLVIDGLNEAEDPREWKIQLGSLKTILPQYPNVLVICTLRSGKRKNRNVHEDYLSDMDEGKPHPFVEQCLPDETLTFEIPSFGDDIREAMEKYFDYFKIEIPPNLVYNRFLHHPLTLRIFCDVTNPSREKPVGMEGVPRTLASLFEKYVDLAATRIEELSPYHCRYYQADITGYLDKLGEVLWKKHSRGINQEQFRTDIKDNGNWNNSAVNFMEQEGLLLRMPGKNSGEDEVVPTYDLLGGYLIAKYIISKNGRDTIGPLLRDKATVKALANSYATQHPLRDDIMQFLAALLPKYHHIHLWQVLGSSLREEALELAILLEPKFLDSPTIEAVAVHIKKSKSHNNRCLERLYTICDAEKHPLNVNFLDKVLTSMKTGDRDLIWTEWLRRNQKPFEVDLDSITASWLNMKERTTADQLMAKWLMWTLTSVNHRIRHKATLALYWYGRVSTNELFELTINSLYINDPYVPERMLAASYGAAMARVSNPSDQIGNILASFAMQIYERIFSAKAERLYTHIFILDYARGIIELAISVCPTLFSEQQLEEVHKTPVAKKKIKGTNTPRESERGQSPFRMDFENYVIGRLIPGRQNYDFEHKSYKEVRSKILSRIFELGWSFKSFGSVDQSIENERSSYNRHEDSDITKTERYGKKYSWIAYYEQIGLRQIRDEKEEALTSRLMDADIDPSFPSPRSADRIIDLDTLGNSDTALQEWIRAGEIPDLGVYLNQDVLDTQAGPWVLLDGDIGQQDERRGRSMFAFFRAFFVPRDRQDELVSLLEKQRLGGRWLPEKYENGDAFAGEIPWSSNFNAREPEPLKFVVSEPPIEVPEEQDKFYLNDIGFELSFFDKHRLSDINFPGNEEDDALSDEDFEKLEVRKETVMVQKMQQQTCEVPVIQPVCDLRTPGKSLYREFTGGSTLDKALITMLGLTTIPQSRDLRNPKGERVTFQNSYEKNSFKNSERLFYLRKDQLDILLKQLDMCLVWAIWGERELSLRQFELLNRNDPKGNQAYADFKQIHVYPHSEENS